MYSQWELASWHEIAWREGEVRHLAADLVNSIAKIERQLRILLLEGKCATSGSSPVDIERSDLFIATDGKHLTFLIVHTSLEMKPHPSMKTICI